MDRNRNDLTVCGIHRPDQEKRDQNYLHRSELPPNKVIKKTKAKGAVLRK